LSMAEITTVSESYAELSTPSSTPSSVVEDHDSSSESEKIL